MLAAEHACVIALGDSLGGGYYDLARVVPSRNAIGDRIAQLRRAAPSVRSLTYTARGHLTPASLVRSEVSRHGCGEVLLYAAGSGYERAPAVNIGMQLGRRAVRHQDVTVAALRALIRAERRVTFLLVLDAPFASGFQQLVGLPNVRLVATPAAGPSFTYLPEAAVGGTLRSNDTNPGKVLQLTDRLAVGLDAVIDNPCEVTQAAALQRAGKSGFAYLLARGLARGGAADWVARAGVGSPPAVRTAGLSAAAPTCLPADAVTATNDAYTAHNDAFLGISAAQGVLANDADTQHHVVSVDQLDGNGGLLPLHGTSAKGAAVVVHADGGFSYNATGVAAIQALPRGQSTTDTFSYRVTDGLGATDTATVTITVLGTRNHSPIPQGDSATISRTVSLHGSDLLANDTDPDGDHPLSVVQLNGAGGALPLHGTSAKGAAVTLNADGTYTYDPTTSETLQKLIHAQSTPDTFTYGVSDGHGGTATGTVTVTVTGVNHSPVARQRQRRPDGGEHAAQCHEPGDGRARQRQRCRRRSDHDHAAERRWRDAPAARNVHRGCGRDAQRRRHVHVRPDELGDPQGTPGGEPDRGLVCVHDRRRSGRDIVGDGLDHRQRAQRFAGRRQRRNCRAAIRVDDVGQAADELGVGVDERQ